jgi:hypothetical protein
MSNNTNEAFCEGVNWNIQHRNLSELQNPYDDGARYFRLPASSKIQRVTQIAGTHFLRWVDLSGREATALKEAIAERSQKNAQV